MLCAWSSRLHFTLQLDLRTTDLMAWNPRSPVEVRPLCWQSSYKVQF